MNRRARHEAASRRLARVGFMPDVTFTMYIVDANDDSNVMSTFPVKLSNWVPEGGWRHKIVVTYGRTGRAYFHSPSGWYVHRWTGFSYPFPGSGREFGETHINIDFVIRNSMRASDVPSSVLRHDLQIPFTAVPTLPL